MKFIIPIIFAACLVFAGCREDDSTDPGIVYPVWIVGANVYDGFTGNLVTNCARIIWQRDGGEIHTDQCVQAPHRVKAWEHIETNVTVVFHIECDGYYPSLEYIVPFSPPTDTLPGAPGPEAKREFDITLTPAPPGAP